MDDFVLSDRTASLEGFYNFGLVARYFVQTVQTVPTDIARRHIYINHVMFSNDNQSHIEVPSEVNFESIEYK